MQERDARTDGGRETPSTPRPPEAPEAASDAAAGRPDAGPVPEAGATLAREARPILDRLLANIERVIVGKRDRIEFLLVGLLADGHVLLEDIPGVGKSTLARTLARSLDASFRRIQFTPDLMPSDITGVSIFDPRSRAFTFQPGPIFASIVLADEINRATPRTQSALLEAMNVGEVTVDGETRPLPEPFFVVATQNPIEYTGTYPLPESQLDRFSLRIRLDYPSAEQEKAILDSRRRRDPLADLAPVAGAGDVLDLRRLVREVRVEEPIVDYLLGLISATREDDRLIVGASPRASLGLSRAAQALACMRGRDYVLPDDVKELAVPALAHRVLARGSSIGGDATGGAEEVIAELVAAVPVPL